MSEAQQADPSGPPDGPSAAARPCPYGAFVSEALLQQAGDLGRTWVRRGAVAVGGGPAAAADVPVDIAPVEEIVRTLALAAGEGGQWHERAMRTGWSAGTEAMRQGNSLNQLLKELDSGVTLVLSAADAATREYAAPTTARDGLALARRIVDASSLLRLAAAGGYTRAMVDQLRQRYRTIRHDLRNPLGTITTAVALMDDESVPEEMRQHPRVRAMVARNVRSMDAMISATLGDPAAQFSSIAMQTTSLRDLACAVQGDLRATTNGVEVIVSDDLPTFPFDSAGLELLLKAVVIAIARSVRTGSAITIDLKALGARSATLTVGAADESLAPPANQLDLSFARELAARLGGRLEVAAPHRVLIEVPAERPPAADRSARDPLHDVAREGERPDREARPL